MTVELDEGLHRRAKALAAEHGVSLSLLVRGFLADYIGAAEREAEERLEPAADSGRLSVVGELVASGGRARLAPETAKDGPRREWAPFDKGCRNAAYHWKSGPGSPCRFCGGEV